MANIFNNSEFSKDWRPYQKRVLDELNEHLEDGHLHIIAAPGSGKTILGLEVMLRINKPTLILSPSIAIRNQWVERYLSLFSQASQQQVSKNIREPKLITVSTYQGLHAAYCGNYDIEEEPEEDTEENHNSQENIGKFGSEIVSTLQQANIGTVIVDEAHHLRSEWWKCLIDLKEKLGTPTIVALTATPPYDASPLEWERYAGLCGPIDAEISVPELVKEHNLCPHQDYVYFSQPIQKEQAEIKEFRDNVERFIDQVCDDASLTNILAKYEPIINPQGHTEAILSDPSFFSSAESFLRHAGQGSSCKVHKTLGIKPGQLPSLCPEVMENILTGCLFTYEKDFSDNYDYFRELHKSLNRIGAIERRKVILAKPKTITKLLSSSVSKLESIVEIVKTESKVLDQNLRMVILTDYIRKEDLPKSTSDLQPLKRLGVVPIFETLRRSGLVNIRLCVLSGSLVIIPAVARERLLAIATDSGIPLVNIHLTELNCDTQYLNVEISGTDKHSIVTLITELFNTGSVNVITGTASLLGEGWDAPSINALILASYVGSFMLSNQMRGRAIRTQNQQPNKTANIWHLVCVESNQSKLCDDLELLSRRFKAFLGLSNKELRIENGIDRLDIAELPLSKSKIENLNCRMKNDACNRESMWQRWFEVLASDNGIGIMEELRSTPLCLPRYLVFCNSLIALLWQGIFWGAYGSDHIRVHVESDNPFFSFLINSGIIFVIMAIFAMPSFLKSLYLLLKHGPVASSIKQIGNALLQSMIYAGQIKTPIDKLGIQTKYHKYGIVTCSLAGGSAYEKTLFIDALEEVLDPIDNPKYLLERKSLLWFIQRNDFHNVPSILGRNKEYAEYFMKLWNKYVGAARLIYTRTPEGRIVLLKARKHSYSASFQKRSQRAKVWM